MAFREIEILSVDTKGIEMIPDVENMVIVPYALNGAPSEQWKQFFMRRAPPGAKIVGDRAFYECKMDKAVIQRGGECWNRVKRLVDEANARCREVDKQRQQEQAKEREEHFKRSKNNKSLIFGPPSTLYTVITHLIHGRSSSSALLK